VSASAALPADAPRCDVPFVEPIPAASDRGTRWGSPVGLDQGKAAPIDKLQRWLGPGVQVIAEGSRITFQASGLIVLSPDGLYLASADEGVLSVINTLTGARWSMKSWLQSWHSNVSGGPCSMSVEFPAGGDAMLVTCEANAGLIGVMSERLVDRASGRVRAETPQHLQMNASHGFSPGGTKLAIVHQAPDYSPPVLHVFDSATGKRTESGLKGPVVWDGEGELVKSPTPCAPPK